jgi:hypothetical protein
LAAVCGFRETLLRTGLPAVLIGLVLVLCQIAAHRGESVDAAFSGWPGAPHPAAAKVIAARLSGTAFRGVVAPLSLSR